MKTNALEIFSHLIHLRKSDYLLQQGLNQTSFIIDVESIRESILKVAPISRIDNGLGISQIISVPIPNSSERLKWLKIKTEKNCFLPVRGLNISW